METKEGATNAKRGLHRCSHETCTKKVRADNPRANGDKARDVRSNLQESVEKTRGHEDA